MERSSRGRRICSWLKLLLAISDSNSFRRCWSNFYIVILLYLYFWWLAIPFAVDLFAKTIQGLEHLSGHFIALLYEEGQLCIQPMTSIYHLWLSWISQLISKSSDLLLKGFTVDKEGIQLVGSSIGATIWFVCFNSDKFDCTLCWWRICSCGSIK